MPFLSRDWRSPGDQWVRTSEGWERLKLWRIKIFERMNENILARYIYIINFFLMLNSCLLNINYVLVIVDK